MTNSFGIMTDSGADFSPEYQKEHDIILIPTRIMVGEEEFVDRENISREEIIDKMLNEKAKTSTSVAPPVEFNRIIKGSLEKYEKILYIAISSKMSATHDNAILTARRLKTENLIAVDTGNVSWGMALLIDHAVLRRKQGVKIEQVADELNEMLQNLDLIFMAETLEYLRRGGRIGAAKSLLGKLIGVKPILTVKDKVVSSKDTVKSFYEGMEYFYNIIKEKTELYKNHTIAVVYGLETPEFKEFAAKIKHEFKPLKFYYEPIGANIISHVGPEVFGIGILKIPDETIEAYK